LGVWRVKYDVTWRQNDFISLRNTHFSYFITFWLFVYFPWDFNKELCIFVVVLNKLQTIFIENYITLVIVLHINSWRLQTSIFSILIDFIASGIQLNNCWQDFACKTIHKWHAILGNFICITIFSMSSLLMPCLLPIMHCVALLTNNVLCYICSI